MRYSYSRLSSYLTCPSSFKSEYVDQDEHYKPNTIFGSKVHRALQLKSLGLKYTDALDVNSLALYQEALKICRDCEISPNVVDVEVELNFKFAERDFVCHIDRIDFDRETGVFTVVDYKTQSFIPNQNDLKNNLQMALYTAAVAQNYDAEKIVTRLEFLRAGYNYEQTYSKEQMEITEDFVRLTCESIEMGRFDPRINEFCAWCAIRSTCKPYRKILRGQKKLPNNREDLVNHIRILTNRKDEIDEAIKQEIEVKGASVEKDGIIYSSETSIRRSYRLADAKEFLPDDYEIPATAVKEPSLDLIKKTRKKSYSRLVATKAR